MLLGFREGKIIRELLAKTVVNGTMAVGDGHETASTRYAKLVVGLDG